MLRNKQGNRVVLVKGALPHISVFEFTIEGPFEGPDPHTHADETDSFYVLEGELDVYVNGEWTRAAPGAFLSAAPGVEHGFTKQRQRDRAVPEHPRAGRFRAQPSRNERPDRGIV